MFKKLLQKWFDLQGNLNTRAYMWGLKHKRSILNTEKGLHNFGHMLYMGIIHSFDLLGIMWLVISGIFWIIIAGKYSLLHSIIILLVHIHIILLYMGSVTDKYRFQEDNNINIKLNK